MLDAEGYLQFLAQRTLNPEANDGVFQYRPEVVAAAAALIAVNELTVDQAQAVISSHYQMTAGQAENNSSGPTAAPGSASAETSYSPAYGIEGWRVVPVDSSIERLWGQLHIDYSMLDEQATVLHASMRAARLPPPDWRSAQKSSTSISTSLPGSPDLPRFLEITDDTGNRSIAEFSGGRTADDPTWHGFFKAPPLPPETAWISVLGERVDLTRAPAPTRSWVEPLPPQDPVQRHVWERVATLNDFHHQEAALDAAIAALVAAGRTQQDDPLATDARAIVQLFATTRAQDQRIRHRLPSSGPMTLLSSNAPQSWRSLVSRWSRVDGPTGTVVVGAVTPVFEGIKAAVTAIRSYPQYFGIGVVIAPDVRIGLPYRSLDHGRHLTWWAVDDRGNYSLAEPGSWDSQGSRAIGSLLFWPGIDPKATWIDIVPNAETARGVIRVPLPWAT